MMNSRGQRGIQTLRQLRCYTGTVRQNSHILRMRLNSLQQAPEKSDVVGPLFRGNLPGAESALNNGGIASEALVIFIRVCLWACISTSAYSSKQRNCRSTHRLPQHAASSLVPGSSDQSLLGRPIDVQRHPDSWPVSRHGCLKHAHVCDCSEQVVSLGPCMPQCQHVRSLTNQKRSYLGANRQLAPHLPTSRTHEDQIRLSFYRGHLRTWQTEALSLGKMQDYA